MAEKDGADLGAAERQAEVAGGAGVDGVHGEAAGLVGGLFEDVGLEGHRRKSDNSYAAALPAGKQKLGEIPAERGVSWRPEAAAAASVRLVFTVDRDRGLAGAVAQVVQAGLHRLGLALDLDLLDVRGIDRETRARRPRRS